jgi:hypothetical protein
MMLLVNHNLFSSIVNFQIRRIKVLKCKIMKKLIFEIKFVSYY